MTTTLLTPNRAPCPACRAPSVSTSDSQCIKKKKHLGARRKPPTTNDNNKTKNSSCFFFCLCLFNPFRFTPRVLTQNVYLVGGHHPVRRVVVDGLTGGHDRPLAGRHDERNVGLCYPAGLRRGHHSGRAVPLLFAGHQPRDHRRRIAAASLAGQVYRVALSGLCRPFDFNVTRSVWKTQKVNKIIIKKMYEKSTKRELHCTLPSLFFFYHEKHCWFFVKSYLMI